MENLVSNIIKLNIDEIKNYTFPENELFGLEVNYLDNKFCFIINFSTSDKLICFGPGAQSRESKDAKGQLITPPYFHRWTWYEHFDASTISYADPTFFNDNEITLGWFVGEKDHWYIETIASIINNLIENRKIKNENIIFFGSSGGGFSSICLGTLIKKSKVIVNNPQFFILNYYKKHTDKLFEVLHNTFGDISREDLILKIKHRLDVVELFKKENYYPEINYYINSKSSEDLYNQCLPFIKSIEKWDAFDGKFNIHFYKNNSENPHFPMNKDTTINIIKELL